MTIDLNSVLAIVVPLVFSHGLTAFVSHIRNGFRLDGIEKKIDDFSENTSREIANLEHAVELLKKDAHEHKEALRLFKQETELRWVKFSAELNDVVGVKRHIQELTTRIALLESEFVKKQ